MNLCFENMRGGIDCDDVLFDFVGGLADFHNRFYGTNLKRSDFWTYHFNEVIGRPNEETDRRVDEFLDSPYLDDIAPLPGAVEGVRRLKDAGNRLYAVTSRHERLAQRTEAMLDKCYPGTFSEVKFSKNNYTSRGNQDALGKAEICYYLKVAFIIDDSSDYATQCAKMFSDKIMMRNSRVLLMDSPWNRDFKLPGNAWRVGWDAIQRKAV